MNCLSQEEWSLFERTEQLEEQSSADPDENPHKSRYEARENLEKLRQKLCDACQTYQTECPELIASSAWIYFKISRNFVQTEERPAGEEHCLEALKVLGIEENETSPLFQPLALLPETVNVYLNVLNYLGFIAESRADHQTAKRRLGDAETVYAAYKVQSEDSPPLTPTVCLQQICGVHDGCLNVEEFWKDFEGLHTHTIYFLAQVYQNTNELALAANYCEKTLVRQLESGDYEPLEWALNAATLSQFYVDKGTPQNSAFCQARHCLSASEAVLSLYESKQSVDSINDDDREELMDKMLHCQADMYRCWCKYGIALLEMSADEFKKPDEDKCVSLTDVELTDAQPGMDASLAEIEPLFPKLDVHRFESQITCSIVQTFPEAREVFLKVQQWITKAQEYYTLEERATDGVQLIQDHSRLYKVLVTFELAVDRKCKMHKRRVDLLTKLLEELNPSFFLHLCQQLSFELGETFNEMLSLKLDAMDESGLVPNEHQVTKINMLSSQGIEYFKRFISYFSRPDTGLPEKFGEDSVRPVIVAHFYIGRLWSKQLTADPKHKMTNLGHSLEQYRWIVHYCENIDPDCVGKVREEYEACSEMMALLPVKMDRLHDYI